MRRNIPMIVVATTILAAIGERDCRAQDVIAHTAARVFRVESQHDQDVPGVVTALALSPDGRQLVTAGDDHVLRLWNTYDGSVTTRLAGHKDWVRSAVFSPDGSLLATAGSEGALIIWDVAQGTIRQQIRTRGNATLATAFSPNGSRLAAVGFDQQLNVYRTSNGEALHTLDCPCVDNRALAFSPDGSRIAVAGRNGKVHIWDVTHMAEPLAWKADARRIRALAFSPDGKQLATGGDSRTVRIWNAQSGDATTSLAALPGKIMSLVYVDANMLAAGATDNSIHVFDPVSEQQTAVCFGHEGTVSCLAVSRTLGQVYSGSFDTTVRVWEFGTRPEEDVVLQPRDDAAKR